MKKSKIRYLLVILMIAIMTGFTCTFVTAKEGNQRSTRLDFYCEEYQTDWVVEEQWMEDGVLHIRSYMEADTIGYIDGEPFTGNNALNLYNKIHLATGKIICHGEVEMYIKWGELEGTFYGLVNAKGNVYIGPFEGKYAFQGAGDFKGMKLFGIIWGLDPVNEIRVNGMSGIILIPN